MLATLLALASPASAQDGRGECRLVEENGNYRLQLIDFGTVAKRVALRQDGEFHRMLDATETDVFVQNGNAEWVARAFPIDGSNRYDVPCVPGEASENNRDYCRSTPANESVEKVTLAFPDLDAKRVVVRRNNRWQATLPGSAENWTDSNPLVGASYLVRVTQQDGSRIDIACPSVQADIYEVLGNGGAEHLVPDQDVWDTYVDTPNLSGSRVSVEFSDFAGIDPSSLTIVSQDGSAAAVLDRDAPWTRPLSRLDLVTGDVQSIKTNVDWFDISQDGSIIAYEHRGRLRIWRLDPARAAGFTDRSVADVAPFSLEVLGNDYVLYTADEQRYRYDLATGDTLAVPDGNFSNDGQRVHIADRFGEMPGQVVVVETGEVLATYERSEREAVLSGDGQTLVVFEPYWVDGRGYVELLDLDSGEVTRTFVGLYGFVVGVNDDATILQITDDEGEDSEIIDLTTNRFGSEFPK